MFARWMSFQPCCQSSAGSLSLGLAYVFCLLPQSFKQSLIRIVEQYVICHSRPNLFRLRHFMTPLVSDTFYKELCR